MTVINLSSNDDELPKYHVAAVGGARGYQVSNVTYHPHPDPPYRYYRPSTSHSPPPPPPHGSASVEYVDVSYRILTVSDVQRLI